MSSALAYPPSSSRIASSDAANRTRLTMKPQISFFSSTGVRSMLRTNSIAVSTVSSLVFDPFERKVRLLFGQPALLDRPVDKLAVLGTRPVELAAYRVDKGDVVSAAQRRLKCDLRAHRPRAYDRHTLQFRHASEHAAIRTAGADRGRLDSRAVPALP